MHQLYNRTQFDEVMIDECKKSFGVLSMFNSSSYLSLMAWICVMVILHIDYRFISHYHSWFVHMFFWMDVKITLCLSFFMILNACMVTPHTHENTFHKDNFQLGDHLPSLFTYMYLKRIEMDLNWIKMNSNTLDGIWIQFNSIQFQFSWI